MTHDDTQKLLESQIVVKKIANGLNPIDDTPLKEGSFLNDPQVIKPIFYLFDYLFSRIDGKKIPQKRPAKFIITDEQLENVKLPTEKIGVMEFASAVNAVIDPTISKKLNGITINKKLKELGILSEEVNEEGRRKTITNEKSEGYGIESITKNYRGREYEKIVFNDIGKEFLLKNLKDLIMDSFN